MVVFVVIDENCVQVFGHAVARQSPFSDGILELLWEASFFYLQEVGRRFLSLLSVKFSIFAFLLCECYSFVYNMCTYIVISLDVLVLIC